MPKRKAEFVFIGNGTVTSPKGFLASGIACGIKAGDKKDLALIVSEAPCEAWGTFTTNKVQAAPVLVCKENLKPQAAKVRAIVVNSGNANACTGPQGIKDARKMCAVTAKAVGVNPEEVLVASTGIIGVPLPMKAIEQGIMQAAKMLDPEGGLDVAEAIMTTDTRPKHAAVRFKVGRKEVTIGGMAKGAGMICPKMATMLCFLTTDAAISRDCLKKALEDAVERSFNSITVDGDTSTNDTVLLLANGLAGNPRITDAKSSAYRIFSEALTSLCGQLAQAIVRDGEGATKFIEIEVRGAMSDEEAQRVAKSVANSPLFKCAMFGNDPNWGRIACAVGNAHARVSPEKLNVWLGEFQVMKKGGAAKFDREAAHRYLRGNKDVKVTIDLCLGKGRWTVWTCDFSYEYVKINAEYTT